MENKVSPAKQSSTMLSPKSLQSPTKRQVLKEISQNMNTSQISNGESKLSNATTPVSPSNTLSVTPNQVSLSKSSDESSDSSLDYGSANEDSANRDDSLILAFNDIHLNTPKADGNNLREKVLVTSLDGSVKFESNKSFGSDTPRQTDELENIKDSQTDESHSSRKQKVFNIVTECFETPESSLLGDQTLTLSKENLEIGHDPLNVTTDVGTFNLSIPTIDPVLEKSESLVRNSPVPIINDSGVNVLSESFSTDKVINSTFDVCDAEGIAIISPACSEIQTNDNEREHTPDPVTSHQSEIISKSFTISTDGILNTSVTHATNNDSHMIQETSHVDDNIDNLDSVSNDGIVVLKCNEEIDHDLNHVPQDIVENLSEIKSLDIHTESLEKSLHVDETDKPNASLPDASMVKESPEIENNSKTEACLSTTFNVPPIVEDINTTYSEPMDCDVSFVGQIPENVVQPEPSLNPSQNEPSTTFDTHHLPPDNSAILETFQPTNQTYDANIDDSEPMDCDDTIETGDVILQNIQQSPIVSSVVDVNISNGHVIDVMTSNNTQIVESQIADHENVHIDVKVIDLAPKTEITSIENVRCVDDISAAGDGTFISSKETGVAVESSSKDNLEKVNVNVGAVDLETLGCANELVADKQVVSIIGEVSKPAGSPDVIIESTPPTETVSVKDVSISLQQVEISNVDKISESDHIPSEVINVPDAIIESEKVPEDIPLVKDNSVSIIAQPVELPKVASFDDQEINPFATRSRILNTPDRDLCNSSVSLSATTVNTPTGNTYSSQPEIDHREKNIEEAPIVKPKSPEKQIVKKDIQELPANISNISDEEIPPMVFNDAEVINEEPSVENSPEKIVESDNQLTEIPNNKMEDISVTPTEVDIALKSDDLQSMADDCLDEEFKRPLVLQSELMNTDLDGIESDSDTLSVCSLGNPPDINPFETRCKIANSPEKDEDKTLTLNRDDFNDNFETESNATLVGRKSMDSKESVSPANNSLPYDAEGNMVSSVTKDNQKSPISNIHLSETIVISDSPEITNTFKSPPAFKDHLLRKCEKSPDYNENTPKTAKPMKKAEEKEAKEHNFVSPLAHDRRVKELAKRKIADKKVSNLSPMSRCGDLMGLSPVNHTEGECANRFGQVSDEAFSRDPFFCDDFEEFKMPANNFIKDPLDFLLSCGSNPSSQYQCKESLLLKFDPLLSSGRGGLPTGVRPGRETIPESPRVEEDASSASGLAESCSSDSSPLSTSITEGKTFGKMSSMDQSLGAPSPKVVNVTPQPVEKPTQVVAPAVSTRQPVTPISSKNNPVTPAKSVTSAIAAIDRLISLGGTPPPPPVVVQPKEPEMDPRMLAELQSVRELLARQEEELRKTEEQKQSLESQLSDAVSREQTLIDRLNDKKIDRRQMDTVLEEYERTMTQFIGERDVEKRQWEEERAALVRERDEANSHLANMEHSFNDIHAKYERCKVMIQGYKANEEVLKETVRSNDEASKKQLERYEHLRQHAMSQLEIANQEIDSVKKSSQAEIIKLQAMLKKSEINVTSLQESLAQKTKDIEELTAICDELIQKVG